MSIISKMILTFILFISFVVSTHSKMKDQAYMLVNSNNLKSLGFTDGYSGFVKVDLNNDGIDEIIEYNYSSSTPPGTCDKDDCMSSINNNPMLTFQIKDTEDKIIDVAYFCTSVGVLSEMHKGMKDIFCGPKYILRWNGESYETDDD